MSLYQPTFVTPSLLNGDGSGVVSASDDLTITWQINGPDALTGYKLFVNRVSDSAVVYASADFETTGCPAFGKDNLGNVVPFSVTIPNAQMSHYNNGSEYSISIIQVWGDVPSSPDAKGTTKKWVDVASFRASSNPFFIVQDYDPDDPNFSTIYSREYTFDQFTFSDTSPRWFRWRIFENIGDDLIHPVAGNEMYDTGIIYGTGNMTLTYDGFKNDTEICVQCTACDRFGRVVTSDLYAFAVSYTVTTLDFPVTVSALPTGSAIEVHWDGTSYIPAVAEGDYELVNKLLYLPDDAAGTVYWDTVNESPMSFELPWIFVYKGKLAMANAPSLFQITGMDLAHTLGMKYDLNTRTLTVYRGDMDSPVAYYSTPVPTEYEATITAIIYADVNGKVSLWIREDSSVTGLFPSTSLVPSSQLYPQHTTANTWKLAIEPAGGSSPSAASAVTEISVGGKQYCTCVQLFKYSAEALDTLLQVAFYNRDYDGRVFITNDVFFQTDFAKGLDAGSLVGLEGLVGWRIYRASGPEYSYYETLGVLPIATMTMYDYTARTDGTMYQYEICPLTNVNNVKRIDSGIKTEAPFGIKCWEYSLIECEYSEEMKCYKFIAEYLFGKNLKTGDISNNSAPNVLQNFTRYPTVQLPTSNYKSGSLTSLIGMITKTEDGNIAYRDTRTLRDAILELSNTNNSLFLKTRKGDILAVRVANAISMATEDNTPEQAQTASISWVEIDNAEGKFILDYSV